MFERLTEPAREVLGHAQAEARALGHGYIGTEHILIGLLRNTDDVAGAVLASAGVTVEQARAAVERTVGLGPARPDDAAALRAIGIDIDEVRAVVEESFGPGALDRFRRGRRRGRLRPACAPGWGHIPFTPRTKKVLELSLREAISLRHDQIGPEHLLLALVREGEGLAAVVLSEAGLDLGDLRRKTLIALGKVA